MTESESRQQYSESKLKELNKYEDILDVFIHITILRLPTVFILINMTLMIWLVQTVYNAWSTESVPRSLLFFAPLLQNKPITSITMVTSKCPSNMQEIVLKTFPTIDPVKHSNLTKWKYDIKFCATYGIQQANFSLQDTCGKPKSYCSGYCTSNNTQCPITSIRKISGSETILPNEDVIFENDNKSERYVISRQSKSNYVIGVSAQYLYRCANQFHYFNIFTSFEQYWNDTKQCSKQGYLSSNFYHVFDSMNVSNFLFTNGIWMNQISKVILDEDVDIGYMLNLNYNTKKIQCSNSRSAAKIIPERLMTESIQSLYSKNLLIMSFVLFTLCWIWLVAVYCCCEGPLVYKNAPVIILAVIEFIAIVFTYSQNKNLIELQTLIQLVSKCIDEPMDAFGSWSIVFSNRLPLVVIIFTCTCFLLTQLVSLYFNYCIYVPYRQSWHEPAQSEGSILGAQIRSLSFPSYTKQQQRS